MDRRVPVIPFDERLAGVGEDEIAELLQTRLSDITKQMSDLSEPVRAPGVQMQFGKRAGDHTSDAVLQMTRTITSAELRPMVAEIDRALAKLSEGSYGTCDACGGPIAPERLEALPWATHCIGCMGRTERT